MFSQSGNKDSLSHTYISLCCLYPTSVSILRFFRYSDVARLSAYPR